MKRHAYSFAISGAGVSRLKQLRGETRETLRYEFRRLVWALARDREPRFEIDGGATLYNLDVLLKPDEYAGLVIVAARYGVPKQAIGELVVSYYPRETV